MSVNQIMEFIENLEPEESNSLLFSVINALINNDVSALQQMKERVIQMISDDSNPKVTRLY